MRYDYNSGAIACAARNARPLDYKEEINQVARLSALHFPRKSAKIKYVSGPVAQLVRARAS